MVSSGGFKAEHSRGSAKCSIGNDRPDPLGPTGAFGSMCRLGKASTSTEFNRDSIRKQAGLNYVVYERRRRDDPPHGGSLDLRTGSEQLPMKEAGCQQEVQIYS